MRFVIAVLLAALAVSSAAAQQQQQPPRPAQQAKPAQPQAKLAASPQAKPALTPEQQKAKEQEELLRQRALLREKFNKGWDVTAENEKDPRWVASRCKTEARKQFPGIHPIKQRRFTKECIARAGR